MREGLQALTKGLRCRGATVRTKCGDERHHWAKESTPEQITALRLGAGSGLVSFRVLGNDLIALISAWKCSNCRTKTLN